MLDQGFVVPYLEYSRLGEFAEGVIAKHHPSRELPIPVEDIIDKKLGIDVFPLPGLTKAFSADGTDGIVAFVNSSLDMITVDHDAWEAQTTRYRFSIAHELAHVVVHSAIFSKLSFDTLGRWKQAMKAMPVRHYMSLEWQANAFAEHLLVPTTELRVHLAGFVGEIKKLGMDPRDDAIRLLVEKRLGDLFRAHSSVVYRRIERERLLLA